MEKICFLFFFLILATFFTGAQEPLIKELSPVIVESNKKFFSDDQATLSINTGSGSIYRHENLGYILSRKSPLVIRNYGSYGSLTSVSMHGTGSNHTQVSWNGIPLNSPTTGQADLSLLPAGFVQTVEVINGASGSLFGSGTFGGSINLDNKPDWNNRLSSQYSFSHGSYRHFSHMLVLKAGNQKLQYHLTVLRSGAANDFYYKDAYRYGTPRVKNLNNHYRDAGILQNVYLDAGKGNYLESGIWFQKKELEIPAIMGSYEQSTAKQKDSLFRAYFSYRKKSAKSAILLRSAYLSDYLNYTSGSADDSISYIDSKINAGRIINETDFRHFFTPQLIAGGGISHGLIIGRSQNYGGRISENEFAIHANLKYVLKNLILNTGVRKEFYKGLNPTPQYSAGIRYLAAGNLLLRASFSTKFRKPSLNEKYWQPGGNPHLKPERGYGGEIAAEWNMDKDYQDDSDNSIILKGYYQTVDNWIQWVMADSLTPVEYKKVHAGGIEGWLNYSFKVYPFLLSGYLNYNYNRSTIVDTYDDNSLYKGNQLIYIPIHTIGASAALKFKGLILEVSGSYSGYRETVESADKSLRLPAYVLMDLALDYNTNLSNIPIDIWCRFDNVFDTNYEIIRSYAVPGRTIHLGLSVGFEKTRNKTNLNN